MSRPKRRRPKSTTSFTARRRASLVELLESRQLLTAGSSFGYLQVPLAADQSGAALLQDAGLQGAWGVALAPGGGPVWVAGNGANAASRYTGSVSGSPFTASAPVAVPDGSPTGIAFNPTSGFTVGSGTESGTATFLIASQNGEIDGWNPLMVSNQATLGASVSGAEFTGLAVATNSSNQPLLYAADFHNAKIDVFDGNFKATTLSANAFTDSSLPAGYAPYNIELFNNQLYVTYAKPDPNNPSAPLAQAGNGAIVVYNLDGSMVGTTALISGGQLNGPYGMAMAPESSGDFQGDLLVANGGDGHILAFNSSGVFQGYLNDGPGNTTPITISGLRDLAYGNSGAGGTTALFYTAASNGHGQFGEILNGFDQPLVAVPTAFSPEQGQTFSGTLATLTDSDTTLTKDSFVAIINWGDGSSTSAGTVTPNGNGGYNIQGSHLYSTAGTRPVTLIVSDQTHNVSVTALATVTDPSFTPAGTTFSTNETQSFSGSVGSFADPTGTGSQNDYVAIINWGDGQSSIGNVTLTGANTYAVIGNHTYAEVGTLPVNVAVSEVNNGTATTQIGTISSTAMVADPNTLTATATSLEATQGTSTTVTVATFTDTNAAAAADIFSATIDWGDGTTASAGQVTGSDGTFTVTGSHAYLTNGPATVTVSINDSPGTATATAVSTATVADGNTFTPQPMTFVAQTGQSFSGIVALFPDANSLVRASDFTATIDWGDGSTAAAGTLSAANGTLTVSGTHTYTGSGVSPAVNVTVTENGPGTATSNVTSMAVVPKNDVTGTGGTISATATTASTQQVLATFTPNAGNTADAFTATIDWGDGSSFTAGTVTTSGGGTYTVLGSHTYSTPGTFAPDVIVYDSTAGTLTPAAAIPASASVASPVVLTTAAITGTELTTSTYAVATFTDTSQPTLTDGDFTATIDWGDGTSATTGNVTLSGGVFTVTGSHAFADEGTFSVKVTVSETSPSAFSTSITSTASMAEGDSFTTGVVSFSPTAGVSFSGPLAIFTDSNKLAPETDFKATIVWGDGSDATAGTVTGSNGQFTVSGIHTFAQDGSFPVTVTIQDDSGLADAAEKVAESSIFVASPAGFSATPTTLTGTEGTSVSGTLATFTDPGSTAASNAFTAKVFWGDGSSSTAVISGSSGNYTVTGNHTYSDEGTFTVAVSITETANHALLSATSTATIADADSLTATGATFTATAGITFSGAVATFSDVYTGALANDFSATIDWGDGSSTTTGSVTGSNGTYTVSGTHLYSQAGTESPHVTISDDSPGTASATATASASVAAATTTSTATATITGEVFNDVNVNGALDSGETGVAGATVFLNVDGSGKADGTNPQATTDANGKFTLTTTATGTFAVMESITPSHGLTVTTPTQTLSLAAGQTISGVEIGDVLTSTVAPISVQNPPSAGSDANTAYVDALYQLILQRAPDSGGLTFWQGQLTSGASRGSVAADIWDSPEHRGLQVNQYYQEFLGRAGNSTDIAAWVNNFEQNPTVNDETVAVRFLTTSEYQSLHSGSTALVDALYRDVDLRAADSAGESYWVGQLTNGTMTLDEVVNDFVSYGSEANTRLVDSFYSDFLHRAPDSAALSSILGSLGSGTLNADQVAIQLLSSDEFYNNVTTGQAPQFTSAASTSFSSGTGGSFTVKASGAPIGTITVPANTLPAGVTLSDNHDGTATLASTATAAAGTYKFTLTVGNGIGPAATQDFTLTIQ